MNGGLVEHLFNAGAFTLHGGGQSDFKIDCSVLTYPDWEALAALAVKRLPPFTCTYGIARGGTWFAAALQHHATNPSDRPQLLIVDDVLTTGASMEAARARMGSLGTYAIGGVVFARGPCPAWITPLFTLTPERSVP